MPAPRKIIAKVILCTGIALGAPVGGLWAYLLWPEITADPVHRHAMSNFSLLFFGTFGLWALVAWPFAALSERIDPEPPGTPSDTDSATPPTAAPRSRRAHSKASKPEKQQ
jgi:hypothetical protein